MGDLAALHKEVQSVANKEKSTLLARFFKTGKGEYGEGDIFLGLTVPQSRSIAKKYAHLRLEEIEKLLASPFHEERLIALLLLVHNFQKGTDTEEKKKIFTFYLAHTKAINNWDLVDLSAHKIVGEWLVTYEQGITLLQKLASSNIVWERRISIIATFAFINREKAEPTLIIAEMLLADTHDLIHKAVGWALREVGKRISQEKEEAFLQKYANSMPRTMLRYAIEHFPEKLRKNYLNNK